MTKKKTPKWSLLKEKNLEILILASNSMSPIQAYLEDIVGSVLDHNKSTFSNKVSHTFGSSVHIKVTPMPYCCFLLKNTSFLKMAPIIWVFSEDVCNLLAIVTSRTVITTKYWKKLKYYKNSQNDTETWSEQTLLENWHQQICSDAAATELQSVNCSTRSAVKWILLLSRIPL